MGIALIVRWSGREERIRGLRQNLADQAGCNPARGDYVRSADILKLFWRVQGSVELCLTGSLLMFLDELKNTGLTRATTATTP